MADEELTVRPELLHRVGRSLGDTGYRLAHGPAGVPGLTAPAREWSAAQALAGLEAAVHAWCGRLGARVAETGDAVRAAAVAYESVDARAAARLSTVSR
ncbi:type VII secretion target [Micromonospora sp. WMMD1082]|uniref:type VII secretion target n=1 Tax=Micromonospora sp. WMMD1082 TaxID=3016104 RepID=UPI002415B24D|nr:type VII secretion target [Micromonospora sp. WMMD1082]MDG4793959.1 type VII secretion target [Micromonospora sp. WMMD1082]